MENVRIPNKLNLLITLINFPLSLTAIVVGNLNPNYLPLCILLFAFLHLNNYAILHEATHSNLNSTKQLNYWLGVLTGIIFPTSFSIATLTHTKHHCCNRTDHEMFDYYYPSDNLFFKFGQWYSVLLGGVLACCNLRKFNYFYLSKFSKKQTHSKYSKRAKDVRRSKFRNYNSN